jgi:2-deoxy-D-gluconate 3-dehydrogenase
MTALPTEGAQTPDVPSLDLFSLKGKNVLITGGSRGIGAAMAIALAQAGASICLAQNNTSNTSTAETITKLGRKATILPCDLEDIRQVKEIFGQALAVMDDRIDILVNCGAVLQRKDATDITEEEWDNVSLMKLEYLVSSTNIPVAIGS